MDFKIPKLTQRGDFEWLFALSSAGAFCSTYRLPSYLLGNVIDK